MVNLFMAALWLLIGAGFFAWQWLHPEQRAIRIWGSSVSISWVATVAIVLAAYNVVRWWSSRSYARRRHITEETSARRRPAKGRERSQPAATPDPNFNFTDEPR